jgi:hypothetical protein
MHRHGLHVLQEQAEHRTSQRKVGKLVRDLDHDLARMCRNPVGVNSLDLMV